MKKMLMAVVAVVLIVVISVSATFAYLTANDEVVNTFTIGKVQIKLDEADVKPDGTYETNHDSRVQANDYKLLPGHTYIKDPTVTVLKNSEKAYIRMLVKVEGLDGLKAVFSADKYYGAGDVFLLQNFVGGWDSTLWVFDNFTTDTYEFRYYAPVDTLDGKDLVLDDLFETITIPGEDVTNENIDKLDGVKITVTAQAIQADGFANADAAWDKFVAPVDPAPVDPAPAA